MDRRVLWGIGAATALIVAWHVSPAVADEVAVPIPPSARTSDTAEDLDRLRELVVAAIGREEPQSRVDLATGEYTLYWKGEAPPALLQIQQDPPGGTRLVIQPAPYSDAEIARAIERVIERWRSDPGLGLVILAGNGVNSGLQAGIDPHVFEGRGLSRVRAVLEDAAQMPVEVSAEEGVTPAVWP